MALTFQEPRLDAHSGVLLIVHRYHQLIISYLRRMGLWWLPSRCVLPEVASPRRPREA